MAAGVVGETPSTMRKIRVGVADSGINPSFSMAAPVAAGVGVRVRADRAELDGHWQDELGHGTAVAATIRGYSEEAALYPIRIFRKRLVAPVTALVAAIDWAIDHEMDVVNLSLGVTKLQWRQSFEAVSLRARDAGTLLVSAAENQGAPCLPGCLPGVLGVRENEALQEGEFRVEEDFVEASSWARKLPLLPRRANLSGASLAVAHVSGAIVRWFSEVGPQPLSACLRHLRTLARTSPEASEGEATPAST